jgi:integral membrane protein
VQTLNRPYLWWLIIIGIIEGLSTLALFFVAMPMKYWYGMPGAVTLAGTIHGLLCRVLVMMFWVGREAVPLSSKLTWLGLIVAVVPFMPFFVDIPLYRMLRQDERASRGD